MPIVCSSMGASSIFYSRPVGSVKAADHPISYPASTARLVLEVGISSGNQAPTRWAFTGT
jgi:hypothetical protein